MITHELAIKLKDAGFKQTCLDENIDNTSKNNWIESESFACIPTLSELIEACGDGFIGLFREIIDGGIYWKARGIEQIIVEDETPEEAVANLWLKLNKIGKE